MYKWLSTLLQKRSLFDNPANWSAFFGNGAKPPALAGVQLDEQTALTHLPVYAAVNRISQDVSLLDICLDRLLPQGGKRPAIDSPLHKLLTYSPDGVITARRYRQTATAQLCIYGNSYSEIEFSFGGDVLGLHLLQPNHVTPEIVNGELVYWYQSPSQGRIPLPSWKVLHYKMLGNSPLVGLSPIALARETLAIGKAADVFGAAFFGNAARPSGMISLPGKLSDPARKELRESFQSLHGGPMNTGRIIVGEEGMAFTQMSIPPEDAQFLETRRFSIQDVARLYGVPPSKIGDYSESHYANLEEANSDYLQSTLLYFCSVLESEIEFKLLSLEEQGVLNVRHDFRPLLRPNAVARATYNSVAIQWGWRTRNEAREDEGDEPRVGLDNLLMPMNFNQLDQQGNIIPGVPPAPTTPAPSMSATDPNPSQQSNSIAAVAGIVRSELTRALRREVATVKRAAAKPGFRNALDTIYTDHEAHLIEVLTPSLNALATVTGTPIDCRELVAGWVSKSRQELIELEQVSLPEQLPEGIERLTAGWHARIDTTLCEPTNKKNVEAN